MKLKSLVVALGCSFACAAPAFADQIALPAGPILFEDDSAEAIGVDSGANKLLEVGDTLRGILNVPQYKGSDNVLTPIGGTELTGIFEIEVASRTALGLGFYSYVFKPYAGFEATYGAGAMVALFADASPDFCYNNQATCIPLASNGTPWLTLGFDGDPDAFWVAPTAPENTLATTFVSDTTGLGTFRYALNILTNTSGYLWSTVPLECPGVPGVDDPNCGGGGDDQVSARGTGNVLGTTNGAIPPVQTTDFTSTDDIDFRMNRIPEPGSLALLGLGLAGIGFSLRRRS